MFGKKYNRLNFWRISILLMIPLMILNGLAQGAELNGEPSDVFHLLIILILAIWINTLANRIRDYGDNPIYALWSLIPFVNIGLALYYGIIKEKKKDKNLQNHLSDEPSLTKAVINHTKDIACDIKPKVNEYIDKHSNIECDNYQTNVPTNSNINIIKEEEFYEKALSEIEEDTKIKSTWAKALSLSNGDEVKANSLYIKLRVETLNHTLQKELQTEKDLINEKLKKEDELLKKHKREYIKKVIIHWIKYILFLLGAIFSSIFFIGGITNIFIFYSEKLDKLSPSFFLSQGILAIIGLWMMIFFLKKLRMLKKEMK